MVDGWWEGVGQGRGRGKDMVRLSYFFYFSEPLRGIQQIIFRVLARSSAGHFWGLLLVLRQGSDSAFGAAAGALLQPAFASVM